MKDTAIKHALIELQRKTGLVIEPRHEADASAVLGELFDTAATAAAKPAAKRVNTKK